MVRQTQPPEADRSDDLETTSQLPCLDVAAYEEQLARSGRSAESFDAGAAPDPQGPVPVLPPADKLQDIEAWITAQDARSQAYERTVEELQRARTEAAARAENLAIELGVAQQAIHTALCRANDAERAALDRTASARAAESNAELLQHELAETRRELAASLQRRGAADGELRQLHDTLAVREQTHTDLQQRHEALMHERNGFSVRVAQLLERAQSHAWRRGFWECLWQEQDEKLAELSAQCRRTESEWTRLRSDLDRRSSDLAEREAIIARLRTQDATQHAALEELGATRARELTEVRAIGETLAVEFKTLEEKHRASLEALSNREAELAAARRAQAELGEKLTRLEGSAAAHSVRAAEAEGLVGPLGEALERQTDAAQRAGELLQARERELSEVRGRVGALEGRLEAALQQLGEQGARSQASEAQRASSGASLASEERQRTLEQEAAVQRERVLQLQSELAAARSAVSEAESARQSHEKELAQLRETQQREATRTAALEKEQRDLALELERTRGALDERDLQVRRLERYATSSAQVLDRIHADVQRVAAPRAPGGQDSEYQASLVPMDDDAAPAVPLGRRTVIGREPANDLCIPDSSVSRRHAAITIGPNGAFIEDLRSINGVKLNHRRVGIAQLSDGDLIELGTKAFRFTTGRGTPRAESA